MECLSFKTTQVWRMEENTCFWNYLKEEWLLTDEWLYFDLGTVIDFYHLTLVIDSFNSLLK